MDDLHALLEDLTGGDEALAEAAAIGLGRHGEAALSLLRELLSAAETESRWWAVRALAEIAHPETGLLLAQALDDADIGVRQCAALALQRQPTAQAAPKLISLLDDEDALLSRLAVDALIALGSPGVLGLVEVMEGGSQVARLQAVRALALIGDERAAAVLFAALEEDSSLMAYWVSEGLDKMGIGMTFFRP